MHKLFFISLVTDLATLPVTSPDSVTTATTPRPQFLIQKVEADHLHHNHCKDDNLRKQLISRSPIFGAGQWIV
jgi:hypothetical protein